MPAKSEGVVRGVGGEGRAFWLAASVVLVALATPADAAAPLATTAQDLAKGNPSLVPAAEAGAHLTVLYLAAEQDAVTLARDSWEAAQSAPDPSQRYLQLLLANWQAAQNLLAEAQRELGNASAAGRSPGALLVSAHLATTAELNSDLALRLLYSKPTADQLSIEAGRASLARPIALQWVLARGALEGARSATEQEGTWDPAPTLVAIEAAGGVSDAPWTLPEQGPLHRLTRHTALRESATYNATVGAADPGTLVQGDQASLRSAAGRLEAMQFDSSWPTLLLAESSWWLGRLEGGDPNAAVTLVQLHAWNEGATHMAHLLADDAPEESSPWMRVLWAIGLGGLVALGAWGWRKRRGASIALMALTVLLAAPVPNVEAVPDDPRESPAYPADNASSGTWGGQLALADDGTHIFWAHCDGPQQAGCWSIRHRRFDLESGWSETTEAIRPNEAPFTPKAAAHGAQVHLAWVDGTSYNAATPMPLYWCLTQNGVCQETHRVSAANVQVVHPALAVGEDGRPRLAWEERVGEGFIVKFRELTSQGWGPVVRVGDSPIQQYPAVTVDADGTAHIAWRERPAGDASGAARVLRHATVPTGGASANKPQDLSHEAVELNMVALTRKGVGVSALYGTSSDVYLRDFDGSSWGPPQNVSRARRGVSGEAPWLQATDGGLSAFWVTGVPGSFQLWTAQQVDGFWTRPRGLLDGAARQDFFGSSYLMDGRGNVHVLWNVPGQGPLFEVLLDPAKGPPSVVSLSPPEGQWASKDTVLIARIAADAPLSAQGTWFEVDGQRVEGTLSHDGTLRASVDLQDGEHRARIQAVDRDGREATATWSFSTDSQPPLLTVEAVPDQTDGGWSRTPATIRVALGQATPGASPERLQVDLFGAGLWRDIASLPPGLEWDGERIAFNEGTLFGVRVRAIDAAGNVALAPPMQVGWDATPPEIALSAPRFVDGNVTLEATWDASKGAPVTVSATLAGQPAQAKGDVGNVTLAWTEIADGAHAVEMLAIDGAGNVKQQRLDVKVDATPPRIEVHSEGSDVIVQVSDAGGLAAVLVRTPTGTLTESDGLGVSWSKRLASSSGRFEVGATDSSGNRADKFVVVGEHGAVLEVHDADRTTVSETSSGASAGDVDALLLLATLGTVAFLRRSRRWP